MSEKQTHAPEISRRELVSRKEAIFTEHLGEFYGDIYRQVVNLYPCREIEDVSARFDPSAGWFAGGEGEDREGNVIPMIMIGTKNELDSRTIKDRVVSRFGIPRELVESNAGVIMCRLVAFAHELGHVVQMNPQMQEKFGGLEEGYHLPGKDFSDEQYLRYIVSDKERSADYIAATVLPHSKIGQMLEMELPHEEIGQWREWADRHPIVLTSKTRE